MSGRFVGIHLFPWKPVMLAGLAGTICRVIHDVEKHSLPLLHFEVQCGVGL